MFPVRSRVEQIKHGRIAMLAAVAWPLQEIINPFITQAFGMKDVLEASNGASPSLLNGGLFQLEVLPAVLLFFYGASTLERSDLQVTSRACRTLGLSRSLCSLLAAVAPAFCC